MRNFSMLWRFSNTAAHLWKSRTSPFQSYSKYLHTINNDESDLEEIKEQFLKLQGGQVTLEKNESRGIAVIKIDHEDKKNGFSG